MSKGPNNLGVVFDIPKHEVIIFSLSCLFVLCGLGVLMVAFIAGITTNWEHPLFKFLGLGSILTAIAAVLANINFLLMHIRHHKKIYDTHTKL